LFYGQGDVVIKENIVFAEHPLMEHTHVESLLLTEMPNQEEFKNLTVEPEDIRPQSSNWETSKRLKIHPSEPNTTKYPIGESSEQPVCSNEEAAIEPTDRVERNQSVELRSPDDECEVITFIIGAASLHDASNPMPPPRRFVRNQDKMQITQPLLNRNSH
jgi:hypothetical protein